MFQTIIEAIRAAVDTVGDAIESLLDTLLD